MPEGPEIRRQADAIAAAIAGQRLVRVEIGLPRLARYASLLTGQTVLGVTTRGKALLTHFDNDYSMYSHNQLYGRWVVGRANAPPHPTRSLRVALRTRSHSALLYSASDIEILPTPLVAEHPFIRKLGPDVLDHDLTWRAVAARLLAPEFAGRSLTSLYLDQAFLAGVGNYLRSEILYDAQANPFSKPGALRRAEVGALARSTLAISRRAYEQAGVTNRPGLVRTLKRQNFLKRDYRFAAFDREDLPCYRCGTRILRREAGSRRLYYCPRCQGAPAR